MNCVGLGFFHEIILFTIYLLTFSHFRFLLNFTMGSTMNTHGTLDVVETNPFKHLVHLSLKFVAGNDDEIKKYLATCLKSLQVRNII